MILDCLTQIERYRSLHPGIAMAGDWLARSNLSDLAVGRHEIDGERLYATLIDAPGKESARLEAHRRYIDI